MRIAVIGDIHGNKYALECVLEIEKQKMMIVHGSPFKVDEYLFEQEEHLAQISNQIEENVIICGHTHIPYFRNVNGTYFINAGSVGKPKHGDSRATYVIVTINRESVSCSIEKVAYDVEQMVQDIKCNPMISDDLIKIPLV